MTSETPEQQAEPTCAVCGDPITYPQDIEWLDSVSDSGELEFTVMHTHQFHIERCENIGHRFNELGQCEECD